MREREKASTILYFGKEREGFFCFFAEMGGKEGLFPFFPCETHSRKTDGGIGEENEGDREGEKGKVGENGGGRKRQTGPQKKKRKTGKKVSVLFVTIFCVALFEV